MADPAEFDAFFRDNFARIVRSCALLTGDRSIAEDLAAEAFTRLWSRWGRIVDADHAGGYVFKTATRLCAREARRRRLRFAARPQQPDEVGQATLRHDVTVALAGLPLRQRQAVVLRDWAGFPTDEVAAMLGMRESTVRVHLARGRERLREALNMQEEPSHGG
ncbi:MAG TPA: sigma-70 family RNA polymerase sigma factor [Jatrophihabitans sp.]|nr:sigma-70 family RNA polymerase sigma factor [Jatrophihabitans sp.]